MGPSLASAHPFRHPVSPVRPVPVRAAVSDCPRTAGRRRWGRVVWEARGITPLLRTLFAVVGVVALVSETRQSFQQRPEATVADRGSRMAIRLAALAGAGGVVIAKHAVPSAVITSPGGTGWIGLVIVVCGVGLRLWSIRTLGRYFTFTVQTSHDQPVITAGPYRAIRHPGYAGILIVVVGLGIVIDNWVAAVVLVVLVLIGIVYRIRIEERALAQELGGRYQAYAEGRRRLVPFVW